MPALALIRNARFAAFWLGVIALMAGIVLYRMWEVLPWTRAGEYAAMAVAATAVSWLLSRLLRLSFATTCVLVWLVALAWFAGLLPVLATALLALAALAVGSLLVPSAHPARAAMSMVTGLAVIAATIGWLLMFPIHYRIVYALALMAILAIRHRALRELLSGMTTDWREAMAGASWQAAFAMVVLGLASAMCWLPTINNDDLAYHLSLPWQLQELGYYRLDAASHVWALAPWSGDILHAVVQLVAAMEGRGALNALWLALSAALLWRLGEGAGLDRGLRWLGIALYASHPLTAALLGHMQAETPATAGLLALALAIQRAPDRPNAATLRLVAALAGLLMALKLSLALVLVPMLLWLLWRWRGRMPWTALPAALAIGIAIGGSSYVFAWYISGNPVLPLFNSIFKSQYFAPVDFKGVVYPAGLHAALPWHLVFDTSTYMESLDGAAGFALIALAGALAVAITDPRTRPLALVGIACFLLPLSQTQYLRYAHPAMALLVPAMLAGAQAAVGRRSVQAVCVGLCILNIGFMANAQQTLTNGLLRLRVLQGSEAVILRFAPERIINHHLRDVLEQDYLALYPMRKRALAAELGGHGLVTNWYDKQLGSLAEIANADPSGATWNQVFTLTGATHVVFLAPLATPALKAALQRNGSTMELRAGGQAELWKLPPPTRPNAFMARRDIARRIRPF